GGRGQVRAAAARPSPQEGTCGQLLTWLRQAAVDLGVGTDIVERPGEDGHGNGACPRAVRSGLVVVVPLRAGDRPNGEPDNQDQCEGTPHAGLRIVCWNADGTAPVPQRVCVPRGLRHTCQLPAEESLMRAAMAG